MKNFFRLFGRVLLIGFLCLLINSCGGSGGGGNSQSSPPYIEASLISFSTGSAPAGFQNNASVYVIDTNTMWYFVTNALVTMNGVSLTYNTSNQAYEGNVIVDSGSSVTLTVTVGGNTYTTSGTQFTAYPIISRPVTESHWTANSVLNHPVVWSSGVPTTDAYYELGVLDSANPNGNLVWPWDGILQNIPTWWTTYTLRPSELMIENCLIIVGIAKTVTIPTAYAGSSLIISGFNYVPITLTESMRLGAVWEPNSIAVDLTNFYLADSVYGGIIKGNIADANHNIFLASGLNSPRQIAIDSANVYWTEGGGAVKKMAKTGGAITVLATGLSSPYDVVSDGVNVYWTESEAVKKVGINGGTVTTLASGLSGTCNHYMAMDSTSIYWTDAANGTINKVGINGGTVTTLASGLSGSLYIAIDSTNVYWTDNVSGTVNKVGINGGAITTLASGLNPENIAVDSNYVYFWNNYSLDVYSMSKVGKNGGPVTTVATGLLHVFDIAIDSTNAYWTENTGYFYKIPK